MKNKIIDILLKVGAIRLVDIDIKDDKMKLVLVMIIFSFITFMAFCWQVIQYLLHTILSNPIQSIYSLIALFAIVVIYYLLFENEKCVPCLEKKNEWAKDALTAYISPTLVKHIKKNPEELKLGGVRRECTFIFSDLAGFTSLVENSDPSVVVTIMNEYISGMTKIVFEHEGTIDKIVGDGIMVIFSAPVFQEDHAQRAVQCALEMKRYSESFSRRKRSEGISLGDTRIGVNTGTVIIGNVGSETQFAYTAIGDAVNTTARLESANKHLGTLICVSATTVEQCSGLNFRPIGALRLQGKTSAVEAFELIDSEEMNEERISQYRFAYDLMKENHDKAKEAFVNLLFDQKHDPLVNLHLTRLSAGELGDEVVLLAK